MGVTSRSKLYLLITAVLVVVVVASITYYQFSRTPTPTPEHTISRVDEEYAISLANTIEDFIYFMSTEAVSTRVPTAYVVPTILPVLGVPMPGIVLLEEAVEHISSSGIYNVTLSNTTYVMTSNASGEGVLRFNGIVEVNGTSYANYTLSYNVTSTRVQGISSYTIRFSVRGVVLASTDYTKMVFRGSFEGKAFNGTYREWFRTVVVYDEKYRPIEVHTYINNSSKPIVEVYFNHDARKARITIEKVNETMNFSEKGIRLKLKDIRRERLGGEEAYVISYNVYSGNESLGTVEYLVDPTGIPITLYSVNLLVERRDPYGEMKIAFEMKTTSLRFRR